MDALGRPNENYLLEEGLDILHAQSREWLSELELMKRELQFFLNLLDSKNYEMSREEQRRHLFQNMDKLCFVGVHEVQNEVIVHEKELGELHTSKKTNDAGFRSRHKQLEKKVKQLNNDVRTLKMLVFDFIEKEKAKK